MGQNFYIYVLINCTHIFLNVSNFISSRRTFITFTHAAYGLSVKTDALINSRLLRLNFLQRHAVSLRKRVVLLTLAYTTTIPPNFKVVELTVNSFGQSLLRIYHSQIISSLDFNEVVGNSINKAAQPISSRFKRVEKKLSSLVDKPTITSVVKEYPTATHAKSIEYRVSRLQELVDLYDSLILHWGGEKTTLTKIHLKTIVVIMIVM